MCKLRRPKAAKVTAGMSPSTWVTAEARAEGLKVVAEATPSTATVTLQKDESRWDTMQRLAKELGFVCFEAAGTVVFGKPSWLLARTGVRTLNVVLGPGFQPLDGRILARPSVRRSSDAKTNVVELSVSLLPELGQEFAPGDLLVLTGLPYYAGRYIIDGVDIDLADEGLVTISASTPVDPTPEPPSAAGGAAGSTGGADGFGVKSPGAGVYGGTRLTAQQVAAATRVYKAGVKENVGADAIIVAFMVMKVEADFLSPDEAHSDRDSAGPFQQRRAWRRSEKERMDYEIAAHLFWHGGDDGQRGLLQVSNWQHRPKGTVAQVVQGSAYPLRYGKWEAMATALYKAIAATATSASYSTGHGTTSKTVEAFVQLALKQAGKRYIFGVEASMSDPDPDAFDCSELVEWCAYRVGITPRVPDGTGGQADFATRHHLWIPYERAVRTRGAILWNNHHTAISLGIGHDQHGTIEAMGRAYGVLRGSTRAGRFDRGWLLPGVQYS